MTETAIRSSISLKGSALMVKEFFHFGINSILYQRGIYPAESFKREKHYGLSLLVSTDKKVQDFMEPMLKQIEYWLGCKQLKRLVVVISSVHNKEPLERWQFDIETDAEITDSGPKSTKQKSDSTIRQEIAGVLRQITASVSFLPLLEQACSFDVLIYTGKTVDAPEGWSDSDACLVQNAEEVQLRSFSTSIHKVEPKVSYKMDE